MNKKPFTKEFVLRTTLQNMRNMIDLSMRKTVARLEDFKDDNAMKVEVLSTLASLDQLHKNVQSIYDNNPELFEEEENYNA
jgi:hypothetical protein